MSVRDINHAEQGSVVRIYFDVIDSGPPIGLITPDSLTATVYEGLDNGGTLVTTLTPVVEDVGKYRVDWDIPRAQTTGIYALYVDAEIGGTPSAYTNNIRFEVFSEGQFSSSSGAPGTGLQGAVAQISAKRDVNTFLILVRAILRDHPQLNRLTDGHEHSLGDIRIAMNMAISQYSTIPPIFTSATTFSNFPSLAMLVMGTVGWLLGSSSFLRLRNDFQYADGNVSVNTENLAGYSTIADKYFNMYQAWVPQYKIAENVRRGWGASPAGYNSEYELLASFLGDSFSGVSFMA